MTSLNNEPHSGGFKPTYLYIKQHSNTGLLYFGKSVRTGKSFEKYLGSGTYWKSHIKVHGEELVETLWYCLFLDQESLSEFGLLFSDLAQIVKSDKWANQIPENGRDYYTSDTTFAKETRLKMSVAKKGKKNPGAGIMCSKRTGDKHPLFGVGHTDETCKKMSESALKRYEKEDPYERTEKNKNYFKNLRWINNGIGNKRIPSEKEIPSGYVYGKIKPIR